MVVAGRLGTAGGGGTIPGEGIVPLAGAGVGWPDIPPWGAGAGADPGGAVAGVSLAGGAISGGGPLSPRCCCEPM